MLGSCVSAITRPFAVRSIGLFRHVGNDILLSLRTTHERFGLEVLMDFFDLLSVLVVLATLAWGLINWKRNRPDQFGFPDSNLLKTLAAFFATGILLKLFLLAFQKHDTLSNRAGNFLVDIILPYGYGAFVSDFSFVRLLTTICGASYAMAICYRGQRFAQTAKNALIVITLLSLGTVWLEPFVSMSAATAGILITLAKVPMKIVDIGVSVFWLIMLWRAFREISRKVGDPWNTPAVSMATVTKLQTWNNTARIANG